MPVHLMDEAVLQVIEDHVLQPDALEPLTRVMRGAIELAVAECGGPSYVFPATQFGGRAWSRRRTPNSPTIRDLVDVGLAPPWRR